MGNTPEEVTIHIVRAADQAAELAEATRQQAEQMQPGSLAFEFASASAGRLLAAAEQIQKSLLSRDVSAE